jgi:hypothetical protein
MTPKEKAKELVDKFYPNVQWKLGQEDCLDRAKRCALIAVDEVIKSIPCIPSPIPCEDINACIIQAREFWQKVKTEIENL